MSTLKIGIIKNTKFELSQYQLDICNYIINSDNLELDAILCPVNTKVYNPKRKFLFRLINKIESILLNKTIEKFDFSNLKTINFTANLDKFTHKIDSENYKKIKDLELDIILRFDLNILKGEILKTAKFGVWSFHHGDNKLFRGSTPGFFEIINKKKYTSLILQKLDKSLDGGQVLSKGSIITNPIYTKNLRKVQSLSLEVFKKSIANLRNDIIYSDNATIYFSQLYRSPSNLDSLVYIGTLINFILKTVTRKILPYKNNNWSIYYNSSSPFISPLYKSKKIIPSNNKLFSADPFLYNKDGQKIIFYEKYMKNKKTGIISYKDLSDSLSYGDLKLTTGHKSYPTIFKHNKSLYLTVESKSNKCLEIYESISFPEKWKLSHRLLEGEQISDPNVFEYNKELWLNYSSGDENNSSQYLYKFDEFDIRKLISHKLNPVSLDVSISRNAGQVFKYGEDYFRPVMVNDFYNYGKYIKLYKIKSLNISSYETEFYQDIRADNFGNNIHHLSIDNNEYVFDISK